MNKYEQLIEYVVNESNEAKAAELFHEIVVEKSRDIYESLMDSEDEFGGDQADELINDISSDETGMREDENDMAPEMGDGELTGDDAGEFGGDEEGGEFGAEEEGEADLEDRVVNLEDSIEELIAQFDSAMGDEMGDEMSMEPGMDDMGMDDEMAGEEEMGMEGRFNEAVSLTKVTKGISNSSEAEGTNKKSINADNSGKKGSVAKPHTPTGTEAKGQSNPAVKPGDGTTEPRESKVKEPKKTGEDGAINKKSLSGS